MDVKEIIKKKIFETKESVIVSGSTSFKRNQLALLSALYFLDSSFLEESSAQANKKSSEIQKNLDSLFVVTSDSDDSNQYKKDFLDTLTSKSITVTVNEINIRSVQSLAFNILKNFQVEAKFLSGAESKELLDRCIEFFKKELIKRLENNSKSSNKPNEKIFQELDIKILSSENFSLQLRTFIGTALDCNLTPEDIDIFGKKNNIPLWCDISKIFARYYEIQKKNSLFDSYVRVKEATRVLSDYNSGKIDLKSLNIKSEKKVKQFVNCKLLVIRNYQDLTYLNQLLLIEFMKINPECKCIILGNENEKTSTFEGNYVDFIETLKRNGKKFSTYKLEPSKDFHDQFAEFFEEKINEAKAEYRGENYKSNPNEHSFDNKNNFIESFKALDFASQIEQVISTIKRLRIKNGYKYSDFSIVARSSYMASEIIKIFSYYKIPIDAKMSKGLLKDEPLVRSFKMLYEVAIDLIKAEKTGTKIFDVNKLILEDEDLVSRVNEVANTTLFDARNPNVEKVIFEAVKSIKENNTASHFIASVWVASDVAQFWQEQAIDGDNKNKYNSYLDLMIHLVNLSNDFDFEQGESSKGLLDSLSYDFENNNSLLKEENSADSAVDTTENEEENKPDKNRTVSDFFNFIDSRKISEKFYKNSSDTVNIYTPNGAVSMESKVVIIIDLNKGLWPNLRIRDSFLLADFIPVCAGFSEKDEENHRKRLVRQLYINELMLFYVSCIKAQEKLCIFSQDNEEDKPSDFFMMIDDIAAAEKTNKDSEIIPDVEALIVELRKKLISTKNSNKEKREYADLLLKIQEAGYETAYYKNWYFSNQHEEAIPAYTEDEKMYLSPSGIANLIKCPLGWFYSKVICSPQESDSLAIGSLVHKIAESFDEESYFQENFLQRLENATDLDNKKIFDEFSGEIERIKTRLMSLRDELIDEYDFETSKSQLFDFSRVIKKLDVCIEKLAAFFFLSAYYKTSACAKEKFIKEVPLKKNLYLRGKIDRIEKSENYNETTNIKEYSFQNRNDDKTMYKVIDYKTGNKSNSNDFDPQIISYQLMLSNDKDCKQINSSNIFGGDLVYLGSNSNGGPKIQNLVNGKFSTGKREIKSISALKDIDKQIDWIYDQIYSSRFKVFSNKGCRNCKCKGFCPAMNEEEGGGDGEK